MDSGYINHAQSPAQPIHEEKADEILLSMTIRRHGVPFHQWLSQLHTGWDMR